MNSQIISNKTKIREIEDVIEIQKASGNIIARQVSFLLPSNIDSTVSANIAKSLDSGLSCSRNDIEKRSKKLQKKIKSCRTLLPDVVSWPSNSDITVLRMKMRLDNNNNYTTTSGDGLHQANSSSMFNLATLMQLSPQQSKYGLHEEILFSLTSWEDSGLKKPVVLKTTNQIVSKKLSKTSDRTGLDTKSKIARFFRLYFCPCCSCLYNMENIRDDSTYKSKKFN